MSAASHAFRLGTLLRLAASLALVATTIGCQTASYYSQAVRGQFALWSRQKPIDDLLKANGTPRELKERLELVLELRRFAGQQLKLPTDGHYLKYADLQRRYVVWNVYAAPEFSLTPKSWWYPVVGSLDYRGYFSESKARAHAGRLKEEGFDVYVGGVTAYSTLGWFRDPVLNTFLFDSDAELGELIFHELAHQRLFIRGDTEFNEAFATAVAEEGTRRWMESRGDSAALAEYRQQARRTAEFGALVSETRSRLETLFASATNQVMSPASADDLRARKQRLLDGMKSRYSELRRHWGNGGEYDMWFNRALNNAQLNTVDTYYRLVPRFRSVLTNCNGDLEHFYQAVGRLDGLSHQERRERLDSLASPQATHAAAERR